MALAYVVAAAETEGPQLQVTVFDDVGGLPGATVMITEEGASSVSALTDARGRVVVEGLREDRAYTVEVSFPGFSTVRQTGVRLPAEIRIPLTEDPRVERIELSGVATPVVDLEKNRSSTVFSGEFLRNLPGGHRRCP